MSRSTILSAGRQRSYQPEGACSHIGRVSGIDSLPSASPHTCSEFETIHKEEDMTKDAASFRGVDEVSEQPGSSSQAKSFIRNFTSNATG